jgi:hypothetical protein
MFTDPLQVDPANNKLVLRYSPHWLNIMTMPCCCIGCCTSDTVTLEFDDSSRTIHISNYRGFCFPFKKKYDYPYDMIGNVCQRPTGLEWPVGSIRDYSFILCQNRMVHTPVLLMRDNNYFKCGPDDLIASKQEYEDHFFALHRFVFGRYNPEYVAPSVIPLHYKDGFFNLPADVSTML